jgi:hypothetical protein
MRLLPLLHPLSLPLLLSLVGCAPDATPESTSHGDETDDPPSDADDRDECRSPALPSCPPGFGFQYHGGAGHDELVIVDLAEVGEPVCEGHGTFIAAESLGGADLVGVHVTRNAYCTFGCFAACTSTTFCWGEAPDGSTCGQCSGSSHDERGCIELVRACLGDDGAELCGDG